MLQHSIHNAITYTSTGEARVGAKLKLYVNVPETSDESINNDRHGFGSLGGGQPNIGAAGNRRNRSNRDLEPEIYQSQGTRTTYRSTTMSNHLDRRILVL